MFSYLKKQENSFTTNKVKLFLSIFKSNVEDMTSAC